MPGAKVADDQLAIKDKVVAAVDMPGIPAGTAGKITFVEGFTWIRYWIRFDNGVQRGSINRKKLARPAEWREILRRREQGIDDDEAAAPDDSNGAAAASGEAAEAGAVVNGVAVPAHLLERSKTRREVLAGG